MSNVTLFDCGADIGLFSAVICARCDRVSRVIAFEPNPAVQDIFNRNISSLRGGEPYGKAVSSFEGSGRLERPNYDRKSDHACYLVQAETGIPVVTIDSFNVSGGDIAIKIDVEGGELEVIRGAARTIGEASRCLVTIEAHPQVHNRTGIKLSDSLAQLNSIRPFRFMVSETGEWIHSDYQVSDTGRVLNIVGITAA
jgi:FkbM family methyltransferase